jgi:23S rRNA (uracil1939-C5)-methyltransferase
LEEGDQKGRQRLGRRGELRRARIEALDGFGFARGSVRVAGVLPGEEVDVRIEHVGKRGVEFGRLDRVIAASPERIDHRCPHFLDCGGCDFLHATLEFQHRFKRERVATALGLPLEQVDPVIASPRPLGYRALAKLVVGPERTLGSYRPRSHDVVSMDGCLVHAPEVESIVDDARGLLRQHTGELDLRYLLVRGSLAEGRSVVTLVSRTEAAPGVRRLAEQLFSREDVARIVLHVNASESDALLVEGAHEEVLYARGTPSERIGKVQQSLASGAFAQVNPLAAEKLYALVAEMIAPRGKKIVDLYSGSGGVALTLAMEGALEVIGVEANASAVAAARASAESLGVTNASFVESDVAAFDMPEVDAVVLNPPRKGAADDVLDRIRAPHTVYISCNPDSLARDLARLDARIDRVVPVDLFPQTQHVETVVLCARSRSS